MHKKKAMAKLPLLIVARSTSISAALFSVVLFVTPRDRIFSFVFESVFVAPVVRLREC